MQLPVIKRGPILVKSVPLRATRGRRTYTTLVVAFLERSKMFGRKPPRHTVNVFVPPRVPDGYRGRIRDVVPGRRVQERFNVSVDARDGRSLGVFLLAKNGLVGTYGKNSPPYIVYER